MLLETAGLFRGLTEVTRYAVSALAVEESRERGTYLFQSGDPATHLYVLQQGRVRVKMGGAGHVALILSDAGDVVGWSGMAGQDFHFATAECLDEVKVWKFDRNALGQVLEHDPVSGMSFYRGLTVIIGRRLVASYGATVSVHGDRNPKYWG